MASLRLARNVEYGLGTFIVESPGNAQFVFEWALEHFRTDPEKAYGPEGDQVVCVMDYRIEETDAESVVQSVKLLVIVPYDGEDNQNLCEALDRFEQHMVDFADVSIDKSISPKVDGRILDERHSSAGNLPYKGSGRGIMDSGAEPDEVVYSIPNG